MNRQSFCVVAAFAMSCVIPAVTAHGRDPPGTAFDFSIGYAHASFDNAGSKDLREQDGVRLEPRFSFTPWRSHPELRLGIGVGLSAFFEENDADDEDGGGGSIFGGFPFGQADNFEQLTLIVPELQLSWRQNLGRPHGSYQFCIEPGVGVGAAIGNYRAGNVVFDEILDEDISHWDCNVSVRPFVRLAYLHKGWTFGAESSYLWTDLDFGDRRSGQVGELYVGLFLGGEL